MSTDVRPALQAFGNNSDRKAVLIARVEGHAAANQIVPGPGFWDGDRGSLLGVTTHSTDMAAIEREGGIAAALLFTLEAWWRMAYFAAPLHVPAWNRLDSAEVQAVRRFPIDWLAAIEPGADTGGVAQEILVWCLSETLKDIADDPERAHRLSELVAEITDMYVRTPPPAREEWRALRKRAVALRDALADGDIVAASAATVVETAAWPINRSGSAVADVLEAYVGTAAAIAMRAEGWGPSDENLKTALEEELNRGFEGTFHIANETQRMAAQEQVRREYDERVNAEHPGFQARTMAMREAVGIAKWSRLYALRGSLLIFLARAPGQL